MAGAAAQQIAGLLADRLAQIVDIAAAWDAAGLAPGSAMTDVWLEARRIAVPGAVWLGMAGSDGRIGASSVPALRGADVARRDWYRAGSQGAAMLPAHEAPLLAAALAYEPGKVQRLLDLAAPVHGADGRPAGVLAVHLSEPALAAEVAALMPEPLAGLRLVVFDADGRPVLGFGGLERGLQHSSRAVPLAFDPATRGLDWAVRIEVVPAAAAIPAANWLLAAAMAGFAGTVLVVLLPILRRRPGAAPRQALPLAAGLAAALLLTGGFEAYAWRSRTALAPAAEALGRSYLAVMLDRQAARLSNAMSLHVMAGQLTAWLEDGDSTAFVAALDALRGRLARPDMAGATVTGLDAAGQPLWASAVASGLAPIIDRTDLAPILDGGADLAFGIILHRGLPMPIMPLAGAIRAPDGRLRSIAVVNLRAGTFSNGLRLIADRAGPAAAEHALLALAREDGAVLIRSDLRELPGERLPAALVDAITAAGGGMVLAWPGQLGAPPDRLLLAQRLQPGSLVSIVSIDIGGLRAELTNRLSLLRAGGLAAATLVLVLASLAMRLAAQRRDREAAEAAAAAADRDAAFFRALTDNLQESVAVLDGEGCVRFHNAQVARMFGAERAAGAIGRNLAELFVEAPLRDIAAGRIRAAVAGAMLPPMRYTTAGPDGRPLIFEGRVIGLPAEVRDVLGGRAIGACLDITERAMAEAARDAAEARIVQLLAAMPGVLLEFDVADAADPWRVTWCSASVERLLGSTPDQAMAPGWWLRLTEGEAVRRFAAALPALRQGRDAQNDVELRTPDGRVRPFHASARLEGRGRAERLVVYLRDVTDERAAAMRLQDLERSSFLAEVAVGFSHEVNQPLSIIGMGVQNLQRTLGRLLPAETAVQARMQRVLDQVLRVGRMTEEFREIGSVVGQRLQPVDPAGTAQAAIGLLAEEAMRANVTLALDLPEGLPWVMGHPLSLRQALVEALRAAIVAHAARESGALADAGDVVMLSARAEGAEVVLAVSDAAGPIPEALLGQVFTPFAPIRTLAPSGGLGLAKCRHAVLAMQGTLGAANLGTGVRLEMRLGATEGAAAPARGLEVPVAG
ncbi:MAG: PAS domain-containing protein [Paracraurococcus sp.]